MSAPSAWTAGRKGLAFLGCLFLSPLAGWGVTAAFALSGGLAALAVAVLPGVLLLGYGIWHARRIMRTIRMRLAGAPAVAGDPIAERAPPAFRTAGRLGGLGAAALLLVGGRLAPALVVLFLAVAWGQFLGGLARDGRLPAPEFE